MSVVPPDAMSGLHAHGPDVRVPPEKAGPLAMIFQEWVSNSLKHGSLSKPDGRIDVRWHDRESDNGVHRLTIEWTETGAGIDLAADAEPEPGLGTRLVDGFARFELRGSVRSEYRQAGVCHVLEATLLDRDDSRREPLPRPDDADLPAAAHAPSNTGPAAGNGKPPLTPTARRVPSPP
jgi:two-component sensor histidine kinase